MDIELTDGILSEILRIFMVIRNGGETEVSKESFSIYIINF